MVYHLLVLMNFDDAKWERRIVKKTRATFVLKMTRAKRESLTMQYLLAMRSVLSFDFAAKGYPGRWIIKVKPNTRMSNAMKMRFLVFWGR